MLTGERMSGTSEPCVNCGHSEDEHDGYGGVCDGDMDADTRSLCGCPEYVQPSQPQSDAPVPSEPSADECGSAWHYRIGGPTAACSRCGRSWKDGTPSQPPSPDTAPAEPSADGVREMLRDMLRPHEGSSYDHGWNDALRAAIQQTHIDVLDGKPDGPRSPTKDMRNIGG